MICQTPSCTRHFACALRAKGVSVAPSATPSRRNNVPPRRPDPAWERGRVGEVRADGSVMPYLSPQGGVMGVKELADNRSSVEKQVKRLKNDPHVFNNERAKAV